MQGVRFSYAHVFQPYKFDGDEDKEPKYSVTLLIPKSKTAVIEKVKKAIADAYNEAKLTLWGNKEAPKYFNPLQDGDEPTRDGEDRGEAYRGCYFVNAKSRTKPGVFDRELNPILDTEEFYSGCWGNASVAFGGFSKSGNKGISCFLNGVQKTKDDEPLGTVNSAEDDFRGLEDDDDL